MNQPFTLTSDREEAILERMAKDYGERLDQLQKDIWNKPLPTMLKLSEDQLLQSYTQNTDPADWPYLQQDNYHEMYKAGIVPPPVSEFWRDLCPLPITFKLARRQFLSLYKKKVQKVVDGD